MSEPQFEKATVYTPKEGDVVVIEVHDRVMTVEQIEQLKSEARVAFGLDVKIVVLSGAHFAGVVRDE